MTENATHTLEAAAQTLIDDSTHYVASVAAMADGNELNATEDIVSASGVKLIARGTRIDARLREKLCGHRLAGKTLDQAITVVGGLRPDSLAVDMGRLIDADSWLSVLAAKSGDPGAVRHGASHLKLPREILFRLTVARDQRAGLYRHSMSVAIISHYIALRLHLNQSAISNVLIAALCHDLGELHIDPTILASGHRVTNEERRFIYVHPITGWLMVRGLAGVHPEAATAILQHHERLDGSGYPYGKSGEAIGLPGRILAAADVSASIMARHGDHRRLSTLLQLNGNKYDHDVLGTLHGTLAAQVPPPGSLERDSVAKRLDGLASVLDGWARVRASADAAQESFDGFLAERMSNLRSIILRFGFDPDSLEVPLSLAEEDAMIAAELTAVVDELQFQLADLAREFDRRIAEVPGTTDPIAGLALNEWRNRLQDCIDV